MKKLIPVLALLGLATSAVAQEKKETKPADAPKAAPATAPVVYKVGSKVDETLKLTDLDGKSITFKDLRGKTVLIHFWSTQCPFEIVADPKFTELEKRWKDNKDVVILAVDANSTEIGAAPSPDMYAAIKKHQAEKGLTFPVYADHGNKLADLFQAQSTPHCFVLNKEGTLVYAGGLDDDPKGDKGEATKHYARDAVEAAVAGKDVAVKESKSYGCGIKRIKPGA